MGLEDHALCGSDVKVVDQLSVMCRLNSLLILLECFQKYLYLSNFKTTTLTFTQAVFWSVLCTLLLQVVFLSVTKLLLDYNFRVLLLDYNFRVLFKPLANIYRLRQLRFTA